MARFSLIPREEHFFHDFVGLSEEIRVGARTLKQMVSSSPPDMTKADAIKDIEHACDGRTRSIIDRLNREIERRFSCRRGCSGFLFTAPARDDDGGYTQDKRKSLCHNINLRPQ